MRYKANLCKIFMSTVLCYVAQYQYTHITCCTTRDEKKAKQTFISNTKNSFSKL